MTIIENPPKTDNLLNYEDFTKVLSVGKNPELREVLRKAADRYLYWTDVKHRVPEKADIDPKMVWAYIKFGRSANRKPTPILDKEKNGFTYWTPDCLLRSISEIDKWSGGLLTSEQPAGLPEKERYIISSLMDEAIASSKLEGATTEYKVAKELLRTGRKPLDKNEQMIVNNWDAMQYIRDNLQKNITISKIKELHSILTKDTMENPSNSGNFRKNDDITVRYRDEVVFIPPKANEVESRAIKLCEFAGINNEDNWIHPVIKGAMIHFWLAYIHPFIDGNGRTARALMYWFLLKQDYAIFQYLSISRHFISSPGQYVKAYQYSENDDNDLTYFLVYNLSAVRSAIDEFRKYIRKKHKEIAIANDLLYKVRGINIRQKSLIYHSTQHPDFVYTIQGHRNTYGIAYDTARKDLLALAKKGILLKRKEGKKLLVFVPSIKAIERLRRNLK